MEVYIYQAAIYCEQCGEDIRTEVTRKGKAPENPDEENTYDSDDYPKGPYPDGGGEADTPQHCDTCGTFLENDLTLEGVGYVETSIVDHLVHNRGKREVLESWIEAYSEWIDWGKIGRQVWGKK